MIYVIADTHFNHENIIKYCNRPFKNASEMNEHIVKKWNSVVGENDTVYHLGDVGFGNDEEIQELLNRLNGDKILIKGNHDLRRGNNGWLRVGFSKVYNKSVIINNMILTHYPIEVDEEYINVFGHIHDKPLDEKYNRDNHFCVSCDVVEYMPVKLEDIKYNRDV